MQCFFIGFRIIVLIICFIFRKIRSTKLKPKLLTLFNITIVKIKNIYGILVLVLFTIKYLYTKRAVKSQNDIAG